MLLNILLQTTGVDGLGFGYGLAAIICNCYQLTGAKAIGQAPVCLKQVIHLKKEINIKWNS